MSLNALQCISNDAGLIITQFKLVSWFFPTFVFLPDFTPVFPNFPNFVHIFLLKTGEILLDDISFFPESFFFFYSRGRVIEPIFFSVLTVTPDDGIPLYLFFRYTEYRFLIEPKF